MYTTHCTGYWILEYCSFCMCTLYTLVLSTCSFRFDFCRWYLFSNLMLWCWLSKRDIEKILCKHHSWYCLVFSSMAVNSWALVILLLALVLVLLLLRLQANKWLVYFMFTVFFSLSYVFRCNNFNGGNCRRHLRYRCCCCRSRLHRRCYNGAVEWNGYRMGKKRRRRREDDDDEKNNEKLKHKIECVIRAIVTGCHINEPWRLLRFNWRDNKKCIRTKLLNEFHVKCNNFPNASSCRLSYTIDGTSTIYDDCVRCSP